MKIIFAIALLIHVIETLIIEVPITLSYSVKANMNSIKFIDSKGGTTSWTASGASQTLNIKGKAGDTIEFKVTSSATICTIGLILTVGRTKVAATDSKTGWSSDDLTADFLDSSQDFYISGVKTQAYGVKKTGIFTFRYVIPYGIYISYYDTTKIIPPTSSSSSPSHYFYINKGKRAVFDLNEYISTTPGKTATFSFTTAFPASFGKLLQGTTELLPTTEYSLDKKTVMTADDYTFDTFTFSATEDSVNSGPCELYLQSCHETCKTCDIYTTPSDDRPYCQSCFDGSTFDSGLGKCICPLPIGKICYGTCIPASSTPITHNYEECTTEFDKEILYLENSYPVFRGINFNAIIKISPRDDSNIELNDFKECFRLLRLSNGLAADDRVMAGIFRLNYNPIQKIELRTYDVFGTLIDNTECSYLLGFNTSDVQDILDDSVTNFNFIKNELPSLLHLNDRTFHRYLYSDFATEPFLPNITKIDLSPCVARLRTDHGLTPTDPIILYVTDMFYTPPTPKPDAIFKVFTDTGIDITPPGGICMSDCIPVSSNSILKSYATCITDLNSKIIYLKDNKPTFTGSDFTAKILIHPIDTSNPLLNDYQECISLLRTANSLAASDNIIISIYNIDKLLVIPKIEYHAFTSIGTLLPHTGTCLYFLDYLTGDVQTVLNNQVTNFNFIKTKLPSLLHLNDRTFHRYLYSDFATEPFLPNITKIDLSPCVARLRTDHGLTPTDPIILYVTDMFYTPPTPKPDAIYKVFTDTGIDITPPGGICMSDCIPVSSNSILKSYATCITDLNSKIIYLKDNKPTFTGSDFTAKILIHPIDISNPLLNDYQECISLLRTANSLAASDNIIISIYNIDKLLVIPKIEYHAFTSIGTLLPHDTTCLYFLDYLTGDVQTVLDDQVTNFNFIKNELPSLLHLNDRTFHRYLYSDFATEPFLTNMTKIDLSPCVARLRTDHGLTPTDPIILYVTDMFYTPPTPKPDAIFKVFTDTGIDITPPGGICMSDCIPVSSDVITKDYTSCITDLNNNIIYLKDNKPAFTGSDFTAKILIHPIDTSNPLLNDYQECISLLRTANSLAASDNIIISIYNIDKLLVIPKIEYHAFTQIGTILPHDTTCLYFLDYLTGDVQTVLDDQVTNFNFIETELISLLHLKDRTFHRYLSTDDVSSVILLNMTYIDINDCQARLLQANSLPMNTQLILYVTDLFAIPPNPPPEATYHIFTPTGISLDPSICSTPPPLPPPLEGIFDYPLPLDKLTPEQLAEAKDFSDAGINIFDPSDPFFTDICVLFPFDESVDIPRKDRVKQFLQNNQSLCPEECVLNDVNYNASQVSCKCPRPPDKNKDLSFDGLKDNIISTLLDANYDIILCYNLVIDVKILSRNIGSWVMIAIAGVIIINMIYGFIKSVQPLEHYLNSLHRIEVRKTIDQIKGKNMAQQEENIQIHMERIAMKSQPVIIRSGPRNKKRVSAGSLPRNTNAHLNDSDVIDNTTKITDKNPKDGNLTNKEKKLSNFVGTKTSKVNSGHLVFQTRHFQKKDSEITLVPEPEEEDYDDMSYEELVEKDKRGILRIYWGYLRLLHPIIFAFFTQSRKVLKSMKISQFLLGIMLDLALSAFFYSDAYISHNYNNEDANNFIYNLPISIFSYLGGSGVNLLLHLLSDSESRINKIEKENSPTVILLQIQKFLKCYRIKMIVYNILQSILLILLWYYATAFCSVYQNSQDEWLISCGISIGISMCIPFVIAIVFTILRMICRKCQCICLYKILSFLGWFF